MKSPTVEGCPHVPLRQPMPPTPYCPRHEYDWPECCRCCDVLRAELRAIDNALRAYWQHRGFSFAVRGRV